MSGFVRFLTCGVAVALSVAFPAGALLADGCSGKAVTQGACPAGAAKSGAVTGGGCGGCKAACSDVAKGPDSSSSGAGSGPVATNGGEGCTKQASECSGCPLARATAEGAGTFNTLIAAVKAAGVCESLAGKGPFTVFAPTDEAFAKLPAGTVDALLRDVPRLQALLKNHVIKGRVTAEVLGNFTSATAVTIEGQPIEIKVCSKTGFHINGAKVTKADIPTPNGVLHVIDRVLVPKAEVATAK